MINASLLHFHNILAAACSNECQRRCFNDVPPSSNVVVKVIISWHQHTRQSQSQRDSWQWSSPAAGPCHWRPHYLVMRCFLWFLPRWCWKLSVSTTNSRIMMLLLRLLLLSQMFGSLSMWSQEEWRTSHLKYVLYCNNGDLHPGRTVGEIYKRTLLSLFHCALKDQICLFAHQRIEDKYPCSMMGRPRIPLCKLTGINDICSDTNPTRQHGKAQIKADQETSEKPYYGCSWKRQ